ncbi:outer membrane beta-barrel protein [Lacibacter sediminis]|uniref:Outer membrane beta-barrel protein n=1 Tax=Lacibacter sediminis TaxID=2760713 RepID=A0A7G5XCK4_9BACT|nr:outer membrane beta-barrel protein [Lacibacter sediminis]QNA43207.1 outer membrane beta-barrel protein [Lacibacter sediminis]
MKKSVLAACLLLLFANVTNSQITKGNLLLGGTTSFSSSKSGDYKLTEFSFAPNIGYFFANNFAGGLRVQIDTYKEDGDEDAYTSTSIAPFVRYYFIPASKEQKVNIFADVAYGFGSSGSGDDKFNMNGYSLMAGPAIFLNPHTALEITLGYSSMKFEDEPDRYNTFKINVGFQIHLNAAKKKE